MEFSHSQSMEDGPILLGPKLAPFNPTSTDVIDVAFSSNMLNLNSNDILYDLGCGDGRVMIKAVQSYDGIKCIGVEYDSKLVNTAKTKIKELKLNNSSSTSSGSNFNVTSDDDECVTIIHGNVLDIDFSNATKLFIYLVPTGIKALSEKLHHYLRNEPTANMNISNNSNSSNHTIGWHDEIHKEIYRHRRIVTYVFSIPTLTPQHVSLYKGATKIYLYTYDSLPEVIAMKKEEEKVKYLEKETQAMKIDDGSNTGHDHSDSDSSNVSTSNTTKATATTTTTTTTATATALFGTLPANRHDYC